MDLAVTQQGGRSRSRSRSRGKKQYGGSATMDKIVSAVAGLKTSPPAVLKGGRRRRTRRGRTRRGHGRRRSTKKQRGGIFFA